MKVFLWSVLIMLYLVTVCPKAICQENDRKLNVVVILADDLGWMDLSCQGSQVYETPNIDRLAAQGIRLQQAYCAYPRCVPSRYGLITGRNPARVKLPGPWQWQGSEYTVAQAFKDAGYRTFFAGKWHLAKGDVLPQHKGFDINVAGGRAGATQSYFYPYTKENGKSKNSLGLEEGGKAGEYLPDRLTDETLNFIRKNKAVPFLVYLSHYSVHTPFEAKAEYTEYFARKISGMTFNGDEFLTEGAGYTLTRQNNPVYAAMVKSLDESVGRVLDVLEELHLDENTIVVFTSDNGGLSSKGYDGRQLATSNLPLRAGKGHGYEGGIRIPLIFKWPGVVRPGQTSDALVSTLDIYPTLIDAAGVAPKPETVFDGVSIAEILSGMTAEVPDRVLYWHSPESRPYSTGDTCFSAIRMGQYKLIDFYDEKRVELYDITADISERHNLMSSRPDVAKKLSGMLDGWRKQHDVYIDDGQRKRRRQVEED